MDDPGPSSSSPRDVPSISLAPFRSKDFMGKFMLPAYNDPPRMKSRIRDNLLYYQTNYFIIWISVYFLASFFRPGRMFCGLISLFLAIIIYLSLKLKHPQMNSLKRQYPYVFAGGIFLAALSAWYFFDTLLYVWGLSFPLLIILSHATFRARTLNNKLTKKINQAMENLGGIGTPMGYLLSSIGVKV
ncbi:PRA1 family protein Jwa [Brevipalpus obovatus]|uniref:PRA1 family protein Jwa n=1 Tax=Brevipalpus obovatus TaxID=246614 RepID=UPI003D9E21BE